MSQSSSEHDTDMDSSSSSSSGERESGGILYMSLDCFRMPHVMEHVVNDMTRDYYMSDDWSIEFYVSQAVMGFIAVGYVAPDKSELILPQLQRSYCVLDWGACTAATRGIAKQARKSEFRLRVNHDFHATLSRITEYHSAKSWLCPKYKQLCDSLFRRGLMFAGHDVAFRFCSVEMYDPNHKLVAGEIGYVVGAVYTSLTGFCEREHARSIGKIQVVALARLLERSGFAFLNLGQPPMGDVMKYKSEIGGIEVDRPQFLQRWNHAISRTPEDLASFLSTNIAVADLI